LEDHDMLRRPGTSRRRSQVGWLTAVTLAVTVNVAGAPAAHAAGEMRAEQVGGGSLQLESVAGSGHRIQVTKINDGTGRTKITGIRTTIRPGSGCELGLADDGDSAVVCSGNGPHVRMSDGADSYFDAGASTSDTVVGLGGDDVITGALEADGGPGRDKLTNISLSAVGGAGDDTFAYEIGLLTGASAGVRLGDVRGGPGRDVLTLAGSASSQVSLDGRTNDGVVGAAPTGNVRSDIEVVIGGGGRDRLTGNGAANRLEGGDGSDVLVGGSGDDVLIGGPAIPHNNCNDPKEERSIVDISAWEEPERCGVRLVCPFGHCSLVEDGEPVQRDHDVLDGGPGADRLAGGGGVDLVSYLRRPRAVVVRQDASAGDGEPGEGDVVRPDIEVVVGTRFDDRLLGGGGKNLLVGVAGNDVLRGGGDDDELRGGTGNDALLGDGGDDVLRGDAGLDRLDGGVGRDMASWSGTAAPVNVSLDGKGLEGAGASRDAVRITVEGAVGGSGNDLLSGSSGRNVLVGGPGDDRLSGGPPATASAEEPAPGSTPAPGSEGQIAVLGDLLSGQDGNDQIAGSHLGDEILGGAGNDTIAARGGADDVDGGYGDDKLDGGDGADRLYGDFGDDTLIGGAMADVLLGSAGADRIEARDGAGGDTGSCGGNAADLAGTDEGDAITDCAGALP